MQCQIKESKGFERGKRESQVATVERKLPISDFFDHARIKFSCEIFMKHYFAIENNNGSREKVVDSAQRLKSVRMIRKELIH